MDLSPIHLAPAVKDYIWGGSRLKNEFNIETPHETAAEAWMLSAHKDGESIVKGGAFDGKPLSEYIALNGGAKCVGERAAAFDFFPILIKLIDAKDNLSIQVHPGDDYALKNEGGYGKTEMWYVVDCDEGAYLYYGLRREVTRDEFLRRACDGTILGILNRVPVHKGDVFFIPAGTVHAICSGILICEIQQNSNTTYRVYDYNRLGADNRPRELHTDKAADVTLLAPPPKLQRRSGAELASCKYFTAEHYTCRDTLTLQTDNGCFRSITVIGGAGTLNMRDTALELKKGAGIFIPAQNAEYEIRGSVEFILSYV